LAQGGEAPLGVAQEQQRREVTCTVRQHAGGAEPPAQAQGADRKIADGLEALIQRRRETGGAGQPSS
jgi:hypothetical protein